MTTNFPNPMTEFINLQRILTQLSEENMGNSVSFSIAFLQFNDGQISNSAQNSFFHAIENVIHTRPFNHDLVAKLCSLVLSKINNEKAKHDLKELFLSILIDRLQNFEAIPFLHKCFLHGMFSTDEIISTILRYKVLSRRNLITILTFFCYFAPVLEKEFPQFFQECYDTMNEKSQSSELPNEFAKFYKKYKYLKQFGWELQNICAHHNYFPGTLEWTIATDDIDALKDAIENNDSNAFKYMLAPEQYINDFEPFSPNKRFLPTVFETAKILTNYPTLLQFAAYHGSVQCFKHFLKIGSNPQCVDQVGATLTQFAAAGGNLEIIQICSEIGISFVRSSHFAAAYNHLEVIEWMMKNIGLRLSASDQMLGSIVHRSAASNNLEILKLCLDDATNEHIESSACYSDSSSNSDNIGNVINLMTRFGETPLHAAAAKGQIEALKLLLSFKQIHPNATGEDGCTPFYFAVLYNHRETVKFLLSDERIDINLPDDDGILFTCLFIKHHFILQPNLDISKL